MGRYRFQFLIRITKLMNIYVRSTFKTVDHDVREHSQSCGQNKFFFLNEVRVKVINLYIIEIY